MRPVDWVVMCVWLLSLVSFGIYRGRGSTTTSKYLLAGKSMPWYAMGLSILATQASAITFISTTGQGFVDGMRFVQFYFGLPIAMILLSATAVPIFHRAKVFTAYEYLEKRFDAKTRALVGLIFLIQRGLAAGIGLYAPAVALASVLGWSDRLITVLIGVLVITYTASGGIKALTWADVQQMTMIFIALMLSVFVIIHALPRDISFLDALHVAGAAGRLNIVDLKLNWSDRYNLWSGLIGGGFLALAYFGCDQSQVQRYLTGKSIAQSRLSLLFNATVKIPMQLFILFIGVMVFVLSLFVPAPIIFQPAEAARAQQTSDWKPVEQQFRHAFEQRRDAAHQLAASMRANSGNRAAAVASFRAAESDYARARQKGLKIVRNMHGGESFDDTNYVFLSFVRLYLPAGLVGLVIGVIFSASMGSTSGEINSLATVSVIDIYRRFFVRDRSDSHYVLASRVLTIFWGAYAVAFAALGARGFGALIVRVNIVGSLFYGGLLGVFVLAFFCKNVGGTAAFWGVIAGEAAIFAVARFTNVSFLWYNVVGCLVVVCAALALSKTLPTSECGQESFRSEALQYRRSSDDPR
jgi:SSS family transporter